MNLVEMGLFLQSRRARILPREVGLPTGPRRRVPGLRRDEVAQLAGASVDYYIELERGRGVQPSTQMLAALARALRLDGDEREHLFRLAGRAVPVAHGTASHVQPAMLALLDRLDTTPARIITDLHETLVQNSLAAALLGPPVQGPGQEPSFVYRWFSDPASRSLYSVEDHPHHSKVMVSDLRAAVGRRDRNDTRCVDMVRHLRRASAEFVELWDTGDVAVRRGDRKRIVHAELGVLDIHCQNLFSEDGQQRLQFFTAPAGSPAVEQLRLLAVIGVQDMADTSSRQG